MNSRRSPVAADTPSTTPRAKSIAVTACIVAQLEIFSASAGHILEHHLDSSLFSNWKRPAVHPVVSPGILERDLAAYHGLGIRSFTTFAVYMDGGRFRKYGFGEPEAYGKALSGQA